METTYRLTQTGKEVQDLLDQVTPNEQAIAAETTRAEAAEQTLQGNVDAEQSAREGADTVLQGNIDAEEAARIAADSTLHGEVTAETSRAEGAEQTLQDNIDAEASTRGSADAVLQGNIDAEEAARIAADNTLHGDVATETSRAESAERANAAAITAEETRATAAEQANASDIAAINAKIPAEATAQNQLADKSYVNSSVATNTATFKGSYNQVLDLHLPVDATRAQVITALNSTIQDADNNDYCFVQIPVDAEHALLIQAVDRYKFNGQTWAFEYALNNSGFTQAQWAALNSGITSGLVGKLNALPTNADLVTLLAGKQDVLSFDQTPTAGSANPVTSAGIKSAIDAISGGSSAALEAEIARAEAAEQTLQDNIDAEETARIAADSALDTRVSDIEDVIPAEATAQNQLADKNYVNTCVATDSATFRGSYNDVTDLHLTVSATRAQIITALAGAIAIADNNDYAFVQIPTDDATPTVIARVERYKFNGQSWAFEYELNNSGFSQAQWDAINSGITSGLVAKLNALPTNSYLQSLLQGLQDNIDAEEAARIAADQTLDGKIGDNTAAITAEETRATAAEQANASAISDEETRATTAEGTLQDNIDAEETARIAADQTLDGKIDDNTAAITAEETRATAAEQANADDIDDIEAKIPTEASSSNQLADKAYVGTAVGSEETRATAAEQANADDIDDIEAKIPAEATAQNQLADKAYVGTEVAAEETRATAAEQANASAISDEETRATTAEETLQDNIDAEEAARIAADQTLDGKIGDNTAAITAEETRATAAEQTNADDIDAIEAKIPAEATAQNQLADKAYVGTEVAAEETRATAAEQANASAISDEETRATTAEETLQDNIDAEEAARIAADQTLDGKIGDNTAAITAEETRATAAEQANADDIDAIEAKIPAEATAQNQLADKAFVNNSIDAAAATYRGAYNLVNDLSLTMSATQAQIATALAGAIATADKNDYCFVQVPVADATPSVIAHVDRYRFNGTAWAFEYALPNSGFTQAQWDAINSGITSGLVAKLSALPSLVELQALFAAKQDVLTFDDTPTANSNNPVKSSGIKSAIDTAVGDEETRARAAEQVNALAIDDVEALIPNQATTQNQLADKAYVQNAIATNTGDFVGTFNSIADLEAVQNPHNNDYGYVISTDQQGNQSYSRYKYNGTTQTWEFEYSLNNSSFTAEEWAAIQSGITSALVTKLSDLYTKAQLDVILDSKQSALTFDNTPTQGSDNPVKSGGIYTALTGKADKVTGATNGDFAGLDANGNLTDSGSKASDFATAAQGAKADSAYQKPSGGIPDTDLSSGVQTSLGKADTALQSQEQADWNETDTDDPAYIKNKPTIPVITGKADKVDGATSGDFAGLDANGNLTDSGSKASDFATAAQGAKADSAYQKPSGGIPDTDLSSAVQTSLGKADTALQSQEQADWNETDTDDPAYIKNKPTIPVITGKADKVSGATENDFAGLDANGNLTDSGSKASDFATAAQGAKADSAYQKPSGGIPDTDLSSGVQTSLGKADTALQSQEQADWNETDTDDPAYIKNKPTIPVITGKADKVTGATNGDFAGLDANGNLTDSGKKASDFATAAQGAKADSAYQKPSGGIPDTDLSSAVQTSLGKADTALQSQEQADWNETDTDDPAYIKNKPTIPVITGKADKVDGATSGDFAGLDANGNLTDSGSKASDFATAAQGAKADSAYQKPSGGIPDTDLSSGVQTSLGKADTALQSQVNADWNASSGAAQILNKPTIPAAQIQSDWNQTNTSAKDYIKNKPTIPSKMSDVADISVVAISVDKQSSCSITGSGNAGKSQTIIYTNSSGSDKVVTVPTTYATPDGAPIELTVVSGGYCEVNYLNVGGTIYARGL